MIPVRAFAGRRVGVLGLGRSGRTAARALIAGGAVAVGWDDAEPARAAAAAEGVQIADLTRVETVRGLARLVVSPGLAHLYPTPHPAVAAALAAGAPLDNDVGLLFWALAEEFGDAPPPVAAVTGSNGKSTTAALLHHLLRADGRAAQLGGNIGRGVLDLEPPGPDGMLVLELSSYQLDLASRLGARVALFLNLSPDHLDRHGGMGGYFAAKRRLILEGRPDLAVIGLGQAEGRLLAAQADAAGIQTSVFGADGPGARPGAQVAEAALRLEPGGLRVELAEAPALRGRHNAENAAAAILAARALGVGPEAIRAALPGFPGLPHRLERVAEIGGVLYVNDSKATNADAAEKALRAYSRIRWIAGGRAKEGGVAALTPLFERIAKTYLIGESAADFAATLAAAGAPHAKCGDLEAALAAAAAEAEPGDVVLLAPAAASFDQFESFEARGDAFRAGASALAAKAAG